MVDRIHVHPMGVGTFSGHPLRHVLTRTCTLRTGRTACDRHATNSFHYSEFLFSYTCFRSVEECPDNSGAAPVVGRALVMHETDGSDDKRTIVGDVLKYLCDRNTLNIL